MSRLLAITLFLGDVRLLQLGGQLGRAKLPYDVLHTPIIQAFHDSMHHVGTDLVRQHVWITSGREALKWVRNQCIPCRRFRPKAALDGGRPSSKIRRSGTAFYLYICRVF